MRDASTLPTTSESRPLRIGICCYPTVGGSGILASSLGAELAKRGHEVHFISYGWPFRMPVDLPRVYFHAVEINTYELFRYPDYTLPLSVKMVEVSRAHNLDILHVHYAVPHATAAVLARDMIGRAAAPKIITTLHGTDTTLLGRDSGYGPAIRYALEQSDAVTAVSAFLRDETHRLLGTDRPIEVIHNFFEPSAPKRTRAEVRNELGIGLHEHLVVHASNLRPLKRVDVLLQTMAHVSKTSPAKLLILAGGDFRPFQADVERLGISDRIIVRKNVLDVEDYLQAADLALSTSDTESFCLSLLEAMCFSCPSVSTRVGGIPELIDEGVTGLFAASDDAQGLANCITQIFNNQRFLVEMGAAAKTRAQDFFSTQRIVPQYEELYRSTLKARAFKIKL